MLGRLWPHPGKLLWLVMAVALLGLVAISCSAPAPEKPAATTPSEPAVTEPAQPAAPVTPPVSEPPAAPPAQPTVSSGPPSIPHTLEGRDNCLMCHSIGAAGVGEPGGTGLTPAHEGRTIEMCRGCHQPKA